LQASLFTRNERAGDRNSQDLRAADHTDADASARIVRADEQRIGLAAAKKHLADTGPWALSKDPEAIPRVHAILHSTVVTLPALGRELIPFLPGTAEAILQALATPADRGPILFSKDRLPRDRARAEPPTKPA
jgi:methionyl-tRNA synthetase